MSLISRAGLALPIILSCLASALASVYITHPYEGITCSGGSECTVTWADDGLSPLLAAVGPSDFALYQGVNTPVQQLATEVDVSQTRALTFIPNSNAGPNADSYWIKLTSLSAKNPNDTSQPYTSFSGRFTLDNMSGVEGNPVSSLTSPLLPSSTPAGSQSGSVTNGVVGTTTLPGTVATGSASTLSSAISALSAISSAASGSLSQLLTTSTATSRTGLATGTGTTSPSGTSAASNGGARSFGRVSCLTNTGKLGAALGLVLFTAGVSAGLL